MDQMEVAKDVENGSTENIQQTLLQEEYLKSFKPLEEGQIVQGTVVQVTNDNVFIDIGYKSEGKIPVSDFQTPPKVGDVIDVFLEKKEGRGGEVSPRRRPIISPFGRSSGPLRKIKKWWKAGLRVP